MPKANGYFSLGEGPKVRPLEIEVDFRSKEPIVDQIRKQIRFLIATGRLRPGDQLPTVRQLAADLRVNFNTVARAYRALDEEGMISTQHGRGTFVLEPPFGKAPEEMRRKVMEEAAGKYVETGRKLGFEESEILDFVRKAFLGEADGGGRNEEKTGETG